MLRSVRTIVAVAALFAAACGGGAKAPSEAHAPSKEPVVQTRAKVLKKRDAALRTFAAPSGAHLNYYGGNVISNVKVNVVFWTAAVDGTTQANIGGFYSAVTNSSYMDWLSEFNTGTQSIGRGSLNSVTTINPGNPNSALNDSDIQAELDAQIGAGALPPNDGNSIYMTYFPPGYTITQGTSQSCVGGGFCAYHGTYNGVSAGELFYGVMPDEGPGSGCDTGCGNDTQFNNLTSVSSHELIEAVTDAEVGLATSFGPPLAWYDPTYGEIGDICNAQHGTAAGYVVQLEFSNVRNDCIANY